MSKPNIQKISLILGGLYMSLGLVACGDSSGNSAQEIAAPMERKSISCNYRISKADIDSYNSGQKYVRLIGFGHSIPCEDGSEVEGTSLGYDRLAILPGFEIYRSFQDWDPEIKKLTGFSGFALRLLPYNDEDRIELRRKYGFEKKFASIHEILKNRSIWIKFSGGGVYPVSSGWYGDKAEIMPSGDNLQFSNFEYSFKSSQHWQILWKEKDKVFVSIRDDEYEREYYWKDSSVFEILDEVYAEKNYDGLRRLANDWEVSAAQLKERYPDLNK